MSIKRTHNPGELDKRLKILNQQLYGKTKVSKGEKVPQVSNGESTSSLGTLDSFKSLDTHKPTAYQSDILYLKHDLIKITTLASLAFGIQFALYFAMVNKMIKLSF